MSQKEKEKKKKKKNLDDVHKKIQASASNKEEKNSTCVLTYKIKTPVACSYQLADSFLNDLALQDREGHIHPGSGVQTNALQPPVLYGTHIWFVIYNTTACMI